MRSTAVILLTLLGFPTAAAAARSGAADMVGQGIEHFQAGDYAAASRAFADAGAAQPNDKRIAFDRACAHAAAGDQADAIEWFQKAALSEDAQLAARCHYNMGCLAAEKARKLFGEKPEEATPEVRKEGLELLELAMGHFRDATSLNENDADARHNLEAARLWTEYIKEVWRKRDLQKERDKMNLLEYLKMLDRKQRALRTTTTALGIEPKSPKRRQAVFNTEKAQRYLAEEIEPLKAKIRASLKPQPAGQATAPAGPPQAPAAPQPNAAKAAEVLTGLADNAGTAMLAAADELRGDHTREAVKVQADAVEKTDQIYMVAAPYVELVKTAIEKQKGLVDLSSRAVGKPKEDTKEKTAGVAEPDKEAKGKGAVPEPEKETQEKDAVPSQKQEEQAEPKEVIDLDEAAWDQGFVTRWTDMIQAKARQGLKNMPPPEPAAKPDPAKAQPPATGPSKPEPAKAAPSQDAAPKKVDPAEAAKKQQEALRKAMEKAVELAPKVKTLTSEAATYLEEKKPADALPKQEEALKLLKEMLPKQDQNQNQKQQQQDKQKNQDKKNQDKNKNDQDKKNKDKKDQDKKDPDKDKKDKDKKDQKDQKDQNKDDQKKNKDKKDQQKKPAGGDKKQKPQPRDLSKQQADAVLRKARQRQQERKKMEKMLQLYLYRPGKVEKDW